MQNAAITISDRFTWGTDNSDWENIFLMIPNACCTLADLKNIHANTVRLKVKRIENTSPGAGHLRSGEGARGRNRPLDLGRKTELYKPCPCKAAFERCALLRKYVEIKAEPTAPKAQAPAANPAA